MKQKQTNYFSVKELMPGVYGFSNCAVSSFLIVGKERALLFDTGYGVADLKQAVEEITKLPLVVVNSHGHFDHTVGNSSFPGPYYMHKADLEVYHRHNSLSSRRMGLEAVQKFQRIFSSCIGFPRIWMSMPISMGCRRMISSLLRRAIPLI